MSQEQIRRKRVREKKTYTSPELMSVLGKVFTCSHCYRSPDVVQVIGWTKNSAKPDAKRRFVFVRRVKFNSNDHMHGGDGRIDQTDVLNITEPTHTGGDERLTLQNYKTMEGQDDLCLRRRDNGLVEELYREDDLNHFYMWCDY